MAGELNIFSNPVYDFEFLGFTFDGKHSSEFGLTVVSPGGLYQENMFASFEDKTIQVTGKEGVYYFGTEIRTKDLSVQLAFDHLTSENYRKIKQWLSPKKIGKLIFDERPYKYYWVKISTPPVFSYIPFEEEIEEVLTHVFKGEISISFISHDPYGYCDTSLLSEIEVYDPESGYIKPYVYGNIPGWYMESGLIDYTTENIISAGNTSFTNVAIGNIANSAIFYNCGVIDSPLKFDFEIAAFNNGGTPMMLNNATTNTSFQFTSLRTIPMVITNSVMNSASYWKIFCDPSKGQVTANIAGTIVNIGSVHNGEFLKLQPGDNILSTNKDITNVHFNFKNIYW